MFALFSMTCDEKFHPRAPLWTLCSGNIPSRPPRARSAHSHHRELGAAQQFVRDMDIVYICKARAFLLCVNPNPSHRVFTLLLIIQTTSMPQKSQLTVQQNTDFANMIKSDHESSDDPSNYFDYGSLSLSSFA